MPAEWPVIQGKCSNLKSVELLNAKFVQLKPSWEPDCEKVMDFEAPRGMEPKSADPTLKLKIVSGTPLMENEFDSMVPV